MNITERDLMVGDWFNFLIDIEGGDTEYDPQNEVYQPMQVRDITSFGVNDGEVSSYEGVVNDIAQLQPIPLTAEILKKNFPTIEDGVTWSETADSDLFNIRVEYDKYVEGIFKYIHQLQHALRLAGIDKEIKL